MSSESTNAFNFKDSLRYFLIILSIFIISLLLSGDRNQGFNIVEGSIWTAESLIADRDFILNKNPTEVNNYRKDIESKYRTLIKYDEVDIHDLGAKMFETSQNLLTNGVAVKSLLEIIYKNPVCQDLNPEAAYYILDKGNLKAFQKDKVQTLKQAKANFKRDMAGNGYYEAGVEDFLIPNYRLDEEYQNAAIEKAVAAFQQDTKQVNKGDTLIQNGELITLENKQLVNSYLSSSSSLKLLSGIGIWQYLGYLILTTLIIFVLIFYLRQYYPDLYKSVIGIGFVLFWPVLFGVFIWLVKGIPALSPYMLPFCIVPIVVKNFFSERLALFIHIIVVLIASYLTGLGYEFTFIQILAGVVSVLVVSETRHWNKFFIAILLILATYGLGFLGINMIQAGQEVMSDLPIFAWLLVNGVLLMLAYPFIPLVERIFGFTSNMTLVELADMNSPLLKEMAMKAPGTLQHSLQVANLAEAATDAIGGNSLMVRTAALYHDIGKLSKPEYFIENNSGKNFHAELNNNFESAKIIIGHVTDGVKMAKKNRLPAEIIDIIETHHGDSRVEYFYRQQLNAEPDREFDETLFRYPGPKPQTKEQGIMMLTDSIEAACKSLKNPSEKELHDFVDKIIGHKIELDQLSECELSFSELETIKRVIKSMLNSIYHVRIEYPEEKKSAE